MLKRTRFFIGISLIVQSITFLVTFAVLAVKKKSLWKTFLAVGAAGGIAGVWLTVSALKQDKKFRRVLDAMDDLCAPDDVEHPDVPVDETADESEFEN